VNEENASRNKIEQFWADKHLATVLDEQSLYTWGLLYIFIIVITIHREFIKSIFLDLCFAFGVLFVMMQYLSDMNPYTPHFCCYSKRKE
jgi:hypothetical protein